MSLAEPCFDVSIRHRVGALTLDVSFQTNASWTVLFGASGSGKSTVLRAIAGLLRPDEGRIICRGTILQEDGEFLAAHRRPVRWAGQTARLFPRMTVRENLQFGAACPAEHDRAIEHFSLRHLRDKRPAELSGGEQQRVAVVAAALGNAQPLLLDEPFTGLDWERRREFIGQLRAWMGNTPVLSVTHDVGEAFLLEAEVVRIRRGKDCCPGTGRGGACAGTRAVGGITGPARGHERSAGFQSNITGSCSSVMAKRARTSLTIRSRRRSRSVQEALPVRLISARVWRLEMPTGPRGEAFGEAGLFDEPGGGQLDLP